MTLARPGAPLASHALTGADARAPDGEDGGLKRLWAVLEVQLQRPRKALPLPWREAFLPPATARLVWHPRSMPARSGDARFRVAIDPLTQWYFVAQASSGGAQPRYFGPIAESSPGVFVDAIGSADAPAKQPARKRAQP